MLPQLLVAAELILACHPGGEGYAAMWKERYYRLDVGHREGPSKGSVLSLPHGNWGLLLAY